MTRAVQQQVKTRERKHTCPPHHFIINWDNVGHCKYCPEVRDFGKSQRRESQLLGLIAKSGGTKGKRRRQLKEELSWERD